MDELETEIARWRAHIDRDSQLGETDREELDAHLRDQIADLIESGLSHDEAFLIAVKRMGQLDRLANEFASEHSGRLWSQLVLSGEEGDRRLNGRWRAALAFAMGAVVTVQVILLVTGYPAATPDWLARNASLLVLPFLAGYFVHTRRLTRQRALAASIPFLVAVLAINLYPFTEGGSTALLAASHLPVALWFGVAYPYLGGNLRSHEGRMDFVRFTGEWVIYYALIALGGGVLVALTGLILEPTGLVDAERVVEWVLPAGATGAVIVAAWLVEAKQRVVENMAPVLTMLFTPLFAIMLISATVVYAFTGFSGGFDRQLLTVFDALLIVVLGLVLYAISARDAATPPGWMDRVQLVTVAGALALDLMVLTAMAARIGELGLTPNRTAALGLNILLLISLGGTAVLLLRFLLGKDAFFRLERWQTKYLPVFAVWAGAVVLVLPVLFAFA